MPYNKYNGNAGRKPAPPNKKLKELALYYNLAVDRLILFLNYYAGTKSNETYWKQQFASFKQLYNEGKNGKAESSIPAGVFAYLKTFLFTTGSNDKTTVVAVNTQEQYFLIQFAEKLFALRNWHSHYCHSDAELYFNAKDKDGKPCLNEPGNFLYERLTNAAEKIIGIDDDLRRYYKAEQGKSFNFFDENLRITEEGRLFFLQFYLTRGEMAECLNNIRGFKKTEGTQWGLKRKIFSLYSKRDGSSLLAVLYKAAEKEENADDKAVKQQMNLFNKFNETAEYLKKKPALMCLTDEIETWRNRQELEKEEIDALPPLRLKNLFTHFAMQYLLDFEGELKLRNKISWRLRDYTIEEVEKEKEVNTGYKKFTKQFTVIKKKPVFGSREFLGERLYSKNGMFYFKLFIDGKKLLCSINEQSLLYWMGALLIEREAPEKIIQRIEAYVKQYQIVVQKLINNEAVDLKKYKSIYPELLHTKLKEWVAAKPDSEKENKYKQDVQKKIKNALDFVNTLTTESLPQMRSSAKNDLLFKWYNYLLPVTSKFSQAKKEDGFYSEIANLSRFHYVPSSYSGDIRKRLLNGAKEKLPAALYQVLTETPYKNIDDVVMAVASYMKDWFEFLLHIVKTEKHPPEWDNNQKTANELKTSPLATWSKMTFDNWHMLARKFSVPNPFIKASRIKAEERKKQLEEFFTGSPIQLPKYIFTDFENRIANVNDGKVFSYAKLIRESPVSEALMPDFYKTNGNDVFLKEKAAAGGYSQIGTLLKEILYEKTTDTLIWAICIEYHKKLFASGKITSISKINYDTVTASTINNHDFVWEIAGKKIQIGQSQLRQLMYDYKIEEIVTIISKDLNDETTIELVNKAFKDNYYQSLRFIQRIFELEECVLNGQCKQLLIPPNKYIDFKTVLSLISLTDWDETTKRKISDLRNDALHTKIPKGMSYTDGILVIEKFLTSKKFDFKQFEVIISNNRYSEV
jgi:hypothetical protein